MTTPNEIVARRLLKQAEWCQSLGSRLYSTLLRQAAEDVRAKGVCWAVLHDHHDDPPGSALALRFLGAVHRIVLQGQAPQLAACYPSAGGDSDCDAPWPRFHAVVQQQAAVLRELVHCPVQTNEAGRCAALLGGFVEVARRTGLPLRLLEVGAAAGLILRWDHYFYEAGHAGWGDPDSPVRISNVFGDVYPRLAVSTRIEEPHGCDTSPIDPATDEGALTLQSYVWPDQMERFRRLTAAIRCCAPCARPCRPRQCGRLDRGGAGPRRFWRGNGGLSLHCVAILVECRPGALQARDGCRRAGRHL